MACRYLSGKTARLWMVLAADCSKAPFSPAAAFAPVWTGLDTAAATYIGNFTAFPNLQYGSAINPVNTAELLGSTGTVEGVESGQAAFQVQHDGDVPIGDKVKSGKLYDFVITFDFTTPGGANAADKIVGRLRTGPFGVPINLNGENLLINIEGQTDGPVYGDVIGQDNT